GPVPKAGGKFLKPDEALRTHPIPVDRTGTGPDIPEADWLVLSSIRQAYDFWGWEHFYKYNPDEGGTAPDDIAKFFKDTGYAQVINSTSKGHWHNQRSAGAARDSVSKAHRVSPTTSPYLRAPLPTTSGKDELTHAGGLITPITGIPIRGKSPFFLGEKRVRAPPPRAPKSPP